MCEIECVVKLGGSAVTVKEKFESERVEEICRATEIVKRLFESKKKCIIVHGAGSFGHHQAKLYQVKNGLAGGDPAECRKGFCLTRRSVTKLNKMIVDALLEASVPAVSQAACGSWVTNNGVVIQDNVAGLRHLVAAGFVPVVHGDAVIDTAKGWSILSGDTLIKVLCEKVTVSRVVFLTDVAGVLTHPPGHSESKLIPKIQVTPEGSVSCNISSSCNQHDVTGGIALKVDTAVDIVTATKGRTEVFVCQIRSDAAYKSCIDENLENLEGTLIKLWTA